MPIGWHPLAIRGDFDRIRIGEVKDGKRYLGNGCHQKIETR